MMFPLASVASEQPTAPVCEIEPFTCSNAVPLVDWKPLYPIPVMPFLRIVKSSEPACETLKSLSVFVLFGIYEVLLSPMAISFVENAASCVPIATE